MKTSILVFLIVTVGLIGYKNFQPTVYNAVNVTENKEVINLSQDDFVGYCGDDAIKATVGIYKVKSLLLNDSTRGLFWDKTYTIALVDTDINTIAHEVSHFVDRVVADKKIHDGETRAYLQGYFTDCVNRKVNPEPASFPDSRVYDYLSEKCGGKYQLSFGENATNSPQRKTDGQYYVFGNCVDEISYSNYHFGP